MKSKEKKSYRFATLTSLVISGLMSVLTALFLYIQAQFDLLLIVIYFTVVAVFSFAIIQFRIQKVIYSRIKNLRDTLSLLESSSIKQDSVTTNMSSLTKEFENYAINKKIELEALKDRDKFRKEYIGNIAHELKTPLFTIQGYIDTLIDGASKNPKLLEKYLERASKGVDRLTYIINDMDLITKLETGDFKLRREDFDIIELIKSVFEILEMRASKKKISLTLDLDYKEGIIVFADPERIRQVLTNLIENAIKYGTKDGTVEVSIEDINSEKKLIRITDNGEGISQDHMGRLFERFYRVDKSGSRKEGGSGLGLSIVKHIIEAHDEKIFVESIKDIGSEFSFTLQKSKDLHPNGEQE